MRLRCLLYPAGVLFAAFSAFGNLAPEALTPAPIPPTLRSGGTVQELDLGSAFRDPDVNTAVRVGVRIGSTVKNVDLVLFDQTQPITVANFLAYVNSGRHNENFFHRSVPGFVVQGGGFKWNATGGVDSVVTDPKIQNEPGRSNLRGTIAMAKLGGDANSATSQWFVNLADNSANLDAQNGGFTVFGRVAGTGMAVIDEVAALPRVNAGGAFDTLPVKDYTTGNIQRVHTVETNSAVISPLRFTAVSSDPSLVGASVAGSKLRLSPSVIRSGTATVTVTATDLDGTSTQANFIFTVVPRSLGWHVELGTDGEPVGFDLNPSDGSALTQDPVPVNFGDIKEGRSISRIFTVKNSGSSNLSGLVLTRQGTNPGDFAVTTPLGATTLAPGESTSFAVTFSPKAFGARSAVFRLASADADQASLDVLVSGVGVFVPPPTLTALSPQSVNSGPNGFLEVPDWRGTLVTATDPELITSFVQSPAPGMIVPLGTYALSFSATNDFGKVSTVQSTLTVRFAPVNASEVNVSGAEIGSPVPAEGSDGLPLGSVLAGFGTPAISDFRHLAARVNITAGRAKFAGIYLEDGAGESRLVAVQGQAAGVAGATFKSFRDPLLAPGGAIAFAAKVAGLKASEDDGVWTDLFGNLSPVLREGSAIPGVEALKLKSVTSLSMTDQALIALVKLVRGVGGVTASSDSALVRITGPSSGILLARTGAAYDGAPIKMLSVLQPAAGSAGQGRWHGTSSVVAKLTLADKRTVAVRVSSDGTLTKLMQSGAEDVSLGVTLTKLGLPALGNPGVAVFATRLKGGEVTAANDGVLYYAADGLTFAEAVREGDVAENVTGPVAFAGFGDPVTNDQGEMLFSATLRGALVNKSNQSGLFVTSGGAAPALVARVGTPATDKEGNPLVDTTWGSITSYALPDGSNAGPIFLAKLKGRAITAQSNLGLWGVDSTGSVRLLLQTGEEITLTAGKKRLAKMSLLNALPGSFGARRSYNATGSLAVHATFSDKTQAILRIDLP